ncbi:MAG: peptide-N-glycosidase F-related protein [Polyangiaceae bacterium]
MRALFKDGGTRHFRWDFAPSWNTQPSATKLSLRFSNQNKGYRPTSATFLYSGGAFTTTYNDPYMPTDVPIPSTAKRVELWAIITGHGAEAHQCAEFCNHKHTFTVNDNAHQKTHPEAGTQSKCEARVPTDAVVPNQAGTWWFGRGGWCPGMQVDPWVTDVTSEVTPGQNATITYKGLYGSATPTEASGNIDMISYLVVYE